MRKHILMAVQVPYHIFVWCICIDWSKLYLIICYSINYFPPVGEVIRVKDTYSRGIVDVGDYRWLSTLKSVPNERDNGIWKERAKWPYAMWHVKLPEVHKPIENIHLTEDFTRIFVAHQRKKITKGAGVRLSKCLWEYMHGDTNKGVRLSHMRRRC